MTSFYVSILPVSVPAALATLHSFGQISGYKLNLIFPINPAVKKYPLEKLSLKLPNIVLYILESMLRTNLKTPTKLTLPSYWPESRKTLNDGLCLICLWLHVSTLLKRLYSQDSPTCSSAYHSSSLSLFFHKLYSLIFRIYLKCEGS